MNSSQTVAKKYVLYVPNKLLSKTYQTSNLEKGDLSTVDASFNQEICTEDNTVVIREECTEFLRRFFE